MGNDEQNNSGTQPSEKSIKKKKVKFNTELDVTYIHRRADVRAGNTIAPKEKINPETMAVEEIQQASSSIAPHILTDFEKQIPNLALRLALVEKKSRAEAEQLIEAQTSKYWLKQRFLMLFDLAAQAAKDGDAVTPEDKQVQALLQSFIEQSIVKRLELNMQNLATFAVINNVGPDIYKSALDIISPEQKSSSYHRTAKSAEDRCFTMAKAIHTAHQGGLHIPAQAEQYLLNFASERPFFYPEKYSSKLNRLVHQLNEFASGKTSAQDFNPVAKIQVLKSIAGENRGFDLGCGIGQSIGGEATEGITFKRPEQASADLPAEQVKKPGPDI